MKFRTLSFIIFALFFIFLNATAQYFPIDRIAAKVDDQIILYSELMEQVNQYLLENQVKNPTEDEFIQMSKDMLESMIDDKIIVLAAKKDENIVVSEEEIEQALEGSINDLKTQYGSDEAFEEQLNKEGFTLESLKVTYRKNIGDQIYKARYINQELSKDIQVTNEELETFYEEHKDEIPSETGEQVEIAHILFAVKAGDDDLKNAAEKIALVKRKLDEGSSFEELAKEYSDDPGSKDNGGDLGFFSLEDMLPRFSAAVAKLQPGEISDIVETDFGFHIIKLEEVKDGKYHAKHILAMVKVSEAGINKAKELAESVKERITNGEDFAQLANEFSDDIETKDDGGNLGTYPIDQIDPNFKPAIAPLKIGEVSDVVQSNYGFHLIKLINKEDSKKVGFEDVKDRLKNILTQEKMGAKYETWVNKLRVDYYVENDLQKILDEQKLIMEKRGSN